MTASRWVTQFESHAFHANWNALKELLGTAEVDDKSVSSSVQELTRLKRVVSFLDFIVEKIDPELVPNQTWDQFSTQVDPCLSSLQNYLTSKNISDLSVANSHADNLLSYLRPYMVLPSAALLALKQSTSAYVTDIEHQVDLFRNDASSKLKVIEDERKDAISNSASVRKTKKRLEEYLKEALENSDEAPSIKHRLETLLVNAENQAGEVLNLHKNLLIGNESEPSLAVKVQQAISAIEKDSGSIKNTLQEVQKSTTNLDAFHNKIFGEPNKEDGVFSGGLDAELKLRISELAALENDQKIKHKALFEQIESLLPGANSAGLANAYKTMKDSFDRPINIYTWLFYWSLLLLVFGAMIVAVDKASIIPFEIKFVDIPEWDVIFRALMFKAPFIAPVIWLTLFSSTRRSQYERLQQEYAHKEALAKSFDSYKKQLQELKDGSEELLKELLGNTIRAISFNASITLDGKHEDKLPAHQILSNLSGEEFSKLGKILDLMHKKAA